MTRNSRNFPTPPHKTPSRLRLQLLQNLWVANLIKNTQDISCWLILSLLSTKVRKKLEHPRICKKRGPQSFIYLNPIRNFRFFFHQVRAINLHERAILDYQSPIHVFKRLGCKPCILLLIVNNYSLGRYYELNSLQMLFFQVRNGIFYTFRHTYCKRYRNISKTMFRLCKIGIYLIFGLFNKQNPETV